MIATRARAIAFLVALLLAGRFYVASALGYVPTRTRSGQGLTWRPPTFRFALGSSTPKGLSPALVRDAARSAAETWNAVECAVVRIEIDDATADTNMVARDGRNVLVSHGVVWCADEKGLSCHDSLNPALTTVRFDPPASGKDRTSKGIAEVDVEINAVHYRWDDPAAANGADLQVVLTHEFGHALGLADACRMPGRPAVTDDRGRRAPDCTAASPDVRASVMWPLGAPNDLRRRQLSADDKRTICSLYPKKGPS